MPADYTSRRAADRPGRARGGSGRRPPSPPRAARRPKPRPVPIGGSSRPGASRRRTRARGGSGRRRPYPTPARAAGQSRDRSRSGARHRHRYRRVDPQVAARGRQKLTPVPKWSRAPPSRSWAASSCRLTNARIEEDAGAGALAERVRYRSSPASYTAPVSKNTPDADRAEAQRRGHRETAARPRRQPGGRRRGVRTDAPAPTRGPRAGAGRRPGAGRPPPGTEPAAPAPPARTAPRTRADRACGWATHAGPAGAVEPLPPGVRHHRIAGKPRVPVGYRARPPTR